MLGCTRTLPFRHLNSAESGKYTLESVRHRAKLAIVEPCPGKSRKKPFYSFPKSLKRPLSGAVRRSSVRYRRYGDIRKNNVAREQRNADSKNLGQRLHVGTYSRLGLLSLTDDLDVSVRCSEARGPRFGPNKMSRTFQARDPDLVIVGVFEICGAAVDACFKSFAKALLGLLMFTLPRAVPRRGWYLFCVPDIALGN